MKIIYLFAFWMPFRIEGSQSVNSISFFCNSRRYTAWIQTIKACSSNNTYLRSTRYQNLNCWVFEFSFNFLFQEWALRESSNHKNEINFFSFCFCLLDELLNLNELKGLKSIQSKIISPYFLCSRKGFERKKPLELEVIQYLLLLLS